MRSNIKWPIEIIPCKGEFLAEIDARAAEVVFELGMKELQGCELEFVVALCVGFGFDEEPVEELGGMVEALEEPLECDVDGVPLFDGLLSGGGEEFKNAV